MAFTYLDPSTYDRDKVRLLVGDTNPDDVLLEDAEITWYLTENGNVYSAAAEACRGIAAKFARNMQRNIGGLSADFGQKFRQYITLADALDKLSSMTAVTPYLSGASRAEREAWRDDSDRLDTIAAKGVHDIYDQLSFEYDEYDTRS